MYEIGDILRMHALRIYRKEPYNPSSGILPFPLLPLTLNDLKEHLPIPSSIIVTFVVLKESIRPLVDPNVDGALKALIVFDDKDGLHKFLFSMRVSDTTASLDVVVSDAVAQRLFRITAQKFLAASPLFNNQLCTMACKRLSDVLHADAKVSYKGTITSFMHEGKKCFFLNSIS